MSSGFPVGRLEVVVIFLWFMVYGLESHHRDVHRLAGSGRSRLRGVCAQDKTDLVVSNFLQTAVTSRQLDLKSMYVCSNRCDVATFHRLRMFKTTAWFPKIIKSSTISIAISGTRCPLLTRETPSTQSPLFWYCPPLVYTLSNEDP